MENFNIYRISVAADPRDVSQLSSKIVIKIKSRADNPYPEGDFEYLNNVLPKDLDYKIIMDIEDDNKLISDSFIVISAPSTLALKSIQKGIPTIVLGDNKSRPSWECYGQIGCFKDYRGLTPLDTQKIFDEIERQYYNGREEEFIKHTIEGGIDYNSTEKYINNIRKLL